jgi:hypothetical protein
MRYLAWCPESSWTDRSVAKSGMSVFEILPLFDEYDAWRAANQAAARSSHCCVSCVYVCALYACSFNN